MTYGQDAVEYELEASDVQALLVNQAFGVSCVRHCFVELSADDAAVSGWLSRVVADHVIDMDAASPSDEVAVNVAFSHHGLDRLGVVYLPRDRPWTGNKAPYRVGMAARLDYLGEVDKVDRWD